MAGRWLKGQKTKDKDGNHVFKVGAGGYQDAMEMENRQSGANTVANLFIKKKKTSKKQKKQVIDGWHRQQACHPKVERDANDRPTLQFGTLAHTGKFEVPFFVL